MPRHQQARLESILPGLFATRPEYPFGGTTTAARAFLVERHNKKRNVLMYASSHIAEYTDHMTELGPPIYQFLTHRDEASPFCNVLKAKVFCHEKERESIEAKGSRVDETFDGSKWVLQNDDDDSDDKEQIIAYHATGHTPGVTIYSWNRENSVVLFTGDTLYGAEDGSLHYAPLFLHPYAEKKRDFFQTLELIRTIHPTYVVPGLSSSSAGTFLFPYDDSHLVQLQEQLAREELG